MTKNARKKYKRIINVAPNVGAIMNLPLLDI